MKVLLPSSRQALASLPLPGTGFAGVLLMQLVDSGGFLVVLGGFPYKFNVASPFDVVTGPGSDNLTVEDFFNLVFFIFFDDDHW